MRFAQGAAFFCPVLISVLRRELAFCKGRSYFDSNGRFQDGGKPGAGEILMAAKNRKRKVRSLKSRPFTGREERIKNMKNRIVPHPDRYQRLVEDMPIGFAHCKMIYKSGKPIDFIYLDVNKAYGKLTGLRNVTGKKITEILPDIWESSAEIFEIYGRVALSGRPEHFERYVKRIKSWLDISVHSPEKEHFVVMVENITVRKQAEEALKESEERFRKIVEQASIAMAVVGMDGGIEFINRKAVTVFGYLHKDIPTMDRWWVQAYPDEVYRKEVVADWTSRIRKALTEGSEIAGNEYRVTCKNGSIKTMFISGVPVADKIFVMFDDITERKRMEEAQKRSETLFSSAFKLSPAATILSWLKDGKCIDANEAYARLVGFSRDELAGKTTTELNIWMSPDERNRMVSGLARAGRLENVPITLRKKDGSLRSTISSAEILVIEGEKYILSFFYDITDIKQAEDALKESEMRYRALVESSPDAITQSDLNGRILMCNQQAALLHGYDRPEDLIGKSAFDLFPPDELERAGSNLQNTLTGKAVRNIEYRFVKKDGSQFHGELSATVITDAEGKPASFVAITRDITERKQAEGAMQSAKQQITEALSFNRMILESSPVGMIVYKASGECVSANPMAAGIIGATTEQLLAQNFRSLETWKRDGLLESADRALTSGKPVIREIHNASSFGKTVWFKTSLAPFAAAGENHFLFLIEDISERKQAEYALRESEEKYRNLVDNANQIIIVAQDGLIKFVNRKGIDLWGYTEQESMSRPFLEFVHPEDRHLIMENHARLIKGDLIQQRYEFRVVTADGRICWVEINPVPIEWKGKPATLDLLTDITQHKRIEEELQKAQKLESLGVLAGGIAHDFNNLLTGIFGYIDLARSVSKDPKSTEYLEATLAAMNRARALTLQLLTFAKGGAPVQKITPLVPFIQDAAQFALSGSNISCKFFLAQNLWPCNIDKNQIGQVIDNIVINGQQAMPNGGDMEITAKNISLANKEHPPLSEGDYVKVSIKDSGIGISKDIMPRIFDPFYTTKTKGHGLGLATCYSIINRHGGCIDVESETGKGSTFHLYLPASRESAVLEAAAAARHKGCGTIVVMDDEEIIRDTVRQMLEAMGYTVVCMNDGKEALDFYVSETRAGRQCSAMIFDLTVPGGMGGIQAVKEVRKLNKEIPVFVISGYADDPVLKNPVNYGFTASISKPFTITELSDMLNKHVVD